jgi:CheY-like chemotaxis protein
MKTRTLPIEWTETPSQPVEILVVDDNEELGELAALMVGATAHARTTVASSPQEALAMFAANPSRWSAVLTDFHMPGMNGHELAVHLREVRPTVPIVVMSGAASLNEACDGLNEPVDFVRKPFFAQTLEHALKHVLG